MIEIINKGLGIETECYYCGTQLKFQWNDMKYLNERDVEYQWSPTHAQKTRYIECPVCHKKVFVRNDDSGWMNGTKRIEEDHKNGVQQ